MLSSHCLTDPPHCLTCCQKSSRKHLFLPPPAGEQHPRSGWLTRGGVFGSLASSHSQSGGFPQSICFVAAWDHETHWFHDRVGPDHLLEVILVAVSVIMPLCDPSFSAYVLHNHKPGQNCFPVQYNYLSAAQME